MTVLLGKRSTVVGRDSNIQHLSSCREVGRRSVSFDVNGTRDGSGDPRVRPWNNLYYLTLVFRSAGLFVNLGR
jgi:hypothetical protein